MRNIDEGADRLVRAQNREGQVERSTMTCETSCRAWGSDLTSTTSLAQRHGSLEEAEVLGEVREEPARMLLMHTRFGGTRTIDMLIGDPLPRIC